MTETVVFGPRIAIISKKDASDSSGSCLIKLYVKFCIKMNFHGTLNFDATLQFNAYEKIFSWVENTIFMQVKIPGLNSRYSRRYSTSVILENHLTTVSDSNSTLASPRMPAVTLLRFLHTVCCCYNPIPHKLLNYEFWRLRTLYLYGNFDSNIRKNASLQQKYT